LKIKQSYPGQRTWYDIFKDFIYHALMVGVGLYGGYLVSIWSIHEQQELSQQELSNTIINILYSLVEEIEYNSQIMQTDIEAWSRDKNHLGPSIRSYSKAAWDASRLNELSTSSIEPRLKFLLCWYYNWITNLNRVRNSIDETLVSGFQILATEDQKKYTKHWKMVKTLKEGYMTKVAQVNGQWTPLIKKLIGKKIGVLEGKVEPKEYIDYLQSILL